MKKSCDKFEWCVWLWLTSASLANGDVVSFITTVDPSFTCANVPTVSSNTITMTIAPPETPSVTITAPQNDVCAGTALTFTASVQNAGASPALQWMVNNTPPAGGGTGAMYSSSALHNGDQVSCDITPGGSNQLVKKTIAYVTRPDIVRYFKS